MKVLKGHIKAPTPDHFMIDIKEGKAKVTCVRIEAKRNEYMGTYENVANVNVDGPDGLFIACVKKGLVGGVKRIERSGRVLQVYIENYAKC